MKAILRMVLLIKAGFYFALGLLMFAAPFTSFYTSLQLPLAQPGFFSQFIGLLLIGFAWLQWHATLDSRLTVAVAKVSGHLSWSTALLIPCWLYLLPSTMYASQVGQTFLMTLAGLLLIFAFLELRLAKKLKTQDITDQYITKQALKQAQVDAKAQAKAQAEAAKLAQQQVNQPVVSQPVNPVIGDGEPSPTVESAAAVTENTTPTPGNPPSKVGSLIDTIKKTF